MHDACRKWRISRKKTWGYRERDGRRRRDYLRLRERYRRRGQQFVYIDESGFERETTRRYGRAPRGQQVHGLRTGRTRPRTSLMAARFEGGDFAAPWLFEGTCNTDIFNGWLESQLCPLPPMSFSLPSRRDRRAVGVVAFGAASGATADRA